MSERIEDSGYIVVKRGKGDKLSDHIKLKEDNWSVGSKKKLVASTRYKMRRIFVGLLDVLDKERDAGNISHGTYRRMRSYVLNLGNDQVRAMETELSSRYNVEFLNYHVEFKVLNG